MLEAQIAGDVKGGGRRRWRVHELMSLDRARERFAGSIYVEINSQDISADFAARLEEVFKPYLDTEVGRDPCAH